MKLIDFSNDEKLNMLMKKMGAEETDWQLSNKRQSINLDELLAKLNTPGGVEFDLDELTICPDGTFEIDGQKVLVYIRDQNYNPYYRYTESGYKFHICDCSTILSFIKNNRFARYVASNYTYGKFLIHRIYKNEIYDKKVVKLNVCKNCLQRLNYKGYTNNKNEIYNNFQLEQYFDEYGSTKFSKTPEYTETSSPLNLYPKNFSKFANSIKAIAKWKCEECGLDLSGDRHLLHVHHIDYDKSNNHPSNLQVLCIRCHAEKDGHSILKSNLEYKKFVIRYLFPYNK